MHRYTFLKLLTGGYFLLILSLLISCEAEKPIQPPTRTWETPIPHQTIPEGLESISAESCGTCHVDHYNEWKTSTHSVALQDMQFQEEFKKDSIFTCLNCHTPLQNQLEYIVTGYVEGDYKQEVKIPNPDFDPVLQQESITCATCHIRDGQVIGPNETSHATHKTVKRPEILSHQICISCHNASAVINPTLVCTFETGEEWENSWAHDEEQTCVDCHMPETERSIFQGMPVKKSRFHNFAGSGIPKFPEMEPQELKGLLITESLISAKYAAGDSLKATITLKNDQAGHNIPTGDPERYIIISFKLMNPDSSIVAEKQYRIGEVWDWYPEAKKVSDNNLKPKEERELLFAYMLTEPGEYVLQKDVWKYRMSEENAKYHHLLGKYPLRMSLSHQFATILVE